MILYEVTEVFRKTKFKDKTDMTPDEIDAVETVDPEHLLQKVHYHSSLRRLKDMFDSAKKGSGIRDSEFKFKDISLPHDSFIITIDDDIKTSTIRETLFHIGDLGGKIMIIAFMAFEGSARGDHVYMNCIMHENEYGHGCKVTFNHHNFDTVFPDQDSFEIEKKLGQYIFNVMTQFNFLLNKSKDLREGVEHRSFKIDKKMKGKNAYRDITIIHLNSHKYLQKKNYSTDPNIEWSNSWKVRGHWRYLQDRLSIGKNRNGDRTEKGRTWVIPFQKQKHLEEKNNIRVMK